jgi:hypothetical protein
LRGRALQARALAVCGGTALWHNRPTATPDSVSCWSGPDSKREGQQECD